MSTVDDVLGQVDVSQKGLEESQSKVSDAAGSANMDVTQIGNVIANLEELVSQLEITGVKDRAARAIEAKGLAEEAKVEFGDVETRLHSVSASLNDLTSKINEIQVKVAAIEGN